MTFKSYLPQDTNKCFIESLVMQYIQVYQPLHFLQACEHQQYNYIVMASVTKDRLIFLKYLVLCHPHNSIDLFYNTTVRSLHALATVF